jgi:hypothetical protein
LKLKKRIDEVSGLTDWTLHYLRPTAATGSLGGVAGIHSRFQYVPEMRDALAK